MKLSLLKILFFNSFCSCANILGIFPFPWYSHTQFQKSLIAAVLDHGHKVTVITELSFHLKHENFTEISFNVSWIDRNNQMTMKKKNLESLFIVIRAAFETFYYHQKQLESLQKVLIDLQHEKFDLLIHEFHVSSTFMAVAEIFNCPIVMSTATATPLVFNSIVGNDINPVTNADSNLIKSAGSHMNIFERFESTIITITMLLIIQPFVDVMNFFVIQKYFPSVHSSKAELENRVVLIIDRTNPVINLYRPTINTVQAGFITIEPAKPLPHDELKKFVDESRTGVIYMSFGSLADPNKMTSKQVSMFFETFKNLEFNFI